MDKIWTFWEGPMPDYIKLCMDTWKRPYTLLNYNNLREYTDLQVHKLTRFTLPQIADIVRVHVLRDQGGTWLDTDTIMVRDMLPEGTLVGDARSRMNTIGFLHTTYGSPMFSEWAEYQDRMIEEATTPAHWGIMGNLFTDNYLNEHKEIEISPVSYRWPETYMIKASIPRLMKYQRFYFEQNKRLRDLQPTDILMLHNSWTPQWYKGLSAAKVLDQRCTLSNILREVI